MNGAYFLLFTVFLGQRSGVQNSGRQLEELRHFSGLPRDDAVLPSSGPRDHVKVPQVH